MISGVSTRPEWDDIWMRLAESLAERSVDRRTKVGCAIVSKDNTQVLSIGYNGNYAGGPNEAESDVPGESGLLHAEVNSIIKLDYNAQKTRVMYVTTSPCRMCAKCIINAKIDEVVFRDLYRDRSGLDLLLGGNVKVRHYKS